MIIIAIIKYFNHFGLHLKKLPPVLSAQSKSSKNHLPVKSEVSCYNEILSF